MICKICGVNKKENPDEICNYYKISIINEKEIFLNM